MAVFSGDDGSMRELALFAGAGGGSLAANFSAGEPCAPSKMTPVPFASPRATVHLLARPLSEVAARLWPTPTAACATGGQTSRGGKRKDELLLSGAVKMWPTPRAASKTGGAGARGNLSAEEIKQVCRAHLNPAWVEWLMGWPINWTALELIGNAGEWQAKTNSGEWWQTDPADLSGEGQIPRTAGKLKNRVQRLQAIGNGQVPAVVKMAWEILTNTP